MKKRAYIKTYDTAGVYKGVFENFAFSDFQDSLGYGSGDLTVIVPRRFDEYNLDGAIDLGYELRVYIADREAPNAKLIYSGEINLIQAKAGKEEEVILGCMGYGFQMALDVLELSSEELGRQHIVHYPPGGNPSSTEIATTIKDIIDLYQGNNTNYKITYDVGGTTIDTTGKSVKTELYLTTTLNAILHIAESLESDWFWRIDPNNNFYLNQISATPDHYFTMGKDIIDIDTERNLRETRNGILIANGLQKGDPDGILKLYSDPTSISTYGRRFEIKKDGRYRATRETADQFGARYISLFKNPLNTVTLRIADSNMGGGYDIDDVNVGDTFKVNNITTNPSLTSNMLITQKTYAFNEITIVASDARVYTVRALIEAMQNQNIVELTENIVEDYTV